MVMLIHPMDGIMLIHLMIDWCAGLQWRLLVDGHWEWDQQDISRAAAHSWICMV